MQLSLLDNFERSTNRQLYLVESLLKEIGNLKYYRTLSEFGKMGNEPLITTILYWTANLAHRQSKGLVRFRGKNQADFLDLTLDGIQLNITDPVDTDMVREYYNNGHRRMRSLLMGHKDLLRVEDKAIRDRILQNYHTLVNHVI